MKIPLMSFQSVAMLSLILVSPSLSSASGTESTADSGEHIFRYDTFGSEDFWGGQLGLHKAIMGEALGGVGAGLTPNQALALGLKVDLSKLPRILVEALRVGSVSLNDPKVTVALIKADAVVGVKGFYKRGRLDSIGVTCALCHSTTTNILLPGIGKRLDGWANRDLDIGAITALSPDLSPIAKSLDVDVPTVRKVLSSWGPGRYDAHLSLDGKAFRPDGETASTLIPPAFGLAGTNLVTYTGAGTIPYWNTYVAVTQMHGKGSFFDPRLNDPARFPLAVRNGSWDIRSPVDLVSPKLSALHSYQLSLTVPKPPRNSYDSASASRGKAIFSVKAKCMTCHVPPTYSDSGWNLHSGEEVGIDNFQAERSPDGKYRTTPLRSLFLGKKGGYYHDGRFKSLTDVVNHYDQVHRLALGTGEKRDLVEFLKSL